MIPIHCKTPRNRVQQRLAVTVALMLALVPAAALSQEPGTVQPPQPQAPAEPPPAEPQTGTTAAPQTIGQPSDQFPNSLFPGSDISGTLELGFRWTAGFRGNRDMYRSIVNLGQGPKLFNVNFNLSSPQGTNRLVDRFSLNASSWGGDPYNTVRVFGEKYGAYRFSFDYRNVKYYNFIPTFANPLLQTGSLLGEHSFDTTRRMADFELVLVPNSWFSPFIGYYGSSGFGPGITTYTGEQNEYPVRVQYADATRTYRAGVSLTSSKANLILEERWMNARDDIHIFQFGGTNFGNRQGPVLGRVTRLNNLDENYHTRGNTPITIGQFSVFPFNKLTVSGRFVYSDPDTDFGYDRALAGQFVSFALLRAFTGERANGIGEAERPHTTGDLAVEFHPFSRLSVVDSLYVDRFHVASSSSLARILSGTVNVGGGPADVGAAFSAPEASSNRFAYNINQNQIDGILTLTRRISVRAGHRYVWSDVELEDQETGEVKSDGIHRNIALAGFKFNLPRRANAFVDFEAGRSDGIYNRTNSLDYNRVRARGNYQIREGLTVTSSVSFIDNKNPQSDIDYKFRNWGYAFSVAYAPAGGDRFSLTLDYSRSDLDSNLFFIIPSTFTRDRSIYVEESHFGGMNASLRLIRGARFILGYGVISVTGNHPLIYHQPVATLEIPVTRRITWVNEWRYYDLNEKLFSFEKFHINLITSALRFGF
jgi:hypothetical protein